MTDDRNDFSFSNFKIYITDRHELSLRGVEGDLHIFNFQIAHLLHFLFSTHTLYVTRFSIQENPRSRSKPNNSNNQNCRDHLFQDSSAFQLSHTKKPMPIPPDNISPATITNHATPMLRRSPVMICGRLKGNNTFVRYFQREKPKAFATFL